MQPVWHQLLNISLFSHYYSTIVWNTIFGKFVLIKQPLYDILIDIIMLALIHLRVFYNSRMFIITIQSTSLTICSLCLRYFNTAADLYPVTAVHSILLSITPSTPPLSINSSFLMTIMNVKAWNVTRATVLKYKIPKSKKKTAFQYW